MQIPEKTLYTGAKMPGIGLGTFGSDHVPAGDVARVVYEALKMGYRYIDCAACYGNEAEIGKAIEESGVPREELFIVSKLWNDMHGNVEKALRKTLADLRLSYLDCYLVHWPFPNYHAPGCDGDARNPASKPYSHETFLRTWRDMEAMADAGLARHIGVSNMTIPKMELLLRDARIAPAVHEMELHPCFQQGELYQYCVDHDIVPIGYCPIGSPARPERDRTAGDFCDTQMPEVLAVAKAHGVHPAVICVKWAAQRGQVPIPFTTKPANALSNLRAVCEDPLTDEEMDLMRSAERNCRLIKGQVFLWEGAESWRDLWDIGGTIR